MEVKPTFFPSVPRIFEKIYTLAIGGHPKEMPEGQFRTMVAMGVKVRDLRGARRAEVPEELREPFDEADEQLFTNVRALFGGRLRQAVTGAAPIAPEILEFFYAVRRARARGLRDDRDGDGRHVLDDRGSPLRHRRPAAARVSR